MKAKIEFDYLYDKEFDLKSKNEVFLFFRNMKEKVCEDLQNKHVSISTLYQERPIWEKIIVKVVS